ncbi:hypothetical protein SEA_DAROLANDSTONE_23 [Streptomyces phage Darolandstone]|uniref:Holin n=1 Tax=Streptomyces phage Darolandstone TaxID=2315716 RepID=A0A386KMD6_9CAUD|nr:hypothetical protein HOU27_gp23 [Streptomyces phage Darolandstone]AYD86214.1 hypothetical protein SEA_DAROLANDSTONE_23 [Streptomyces phage Darolandstone]
MTDANKRTVRTVIQGIVGFAVALPAVVDASGVPESLPWVAAGLAAAGGLARVMALPSVEALLDRFGLGLVDTAPDAGGTPK